MCTLLFLCVHVYNFISGEFSVYSSNFSYLLGSFLFVFTFMNSFSAFHFLKRLK